MANLSKQIAEARSAGVPQWQIDYVLKVIEKYPEQAHLFSSLAAEFEQLAAIEAKKVERASPKNTTLSEATVENHWKVVKPVDQIPTTYNINKPKEAKKVERTSPVANRRDLAQSVYTKTVYEGSSESLIHNFNYGFDLLEMFTDSVDESALLGDWQNKAAVPQFGFDFDAISPSPFDDLEIDLYTKKTNNLEVPVVKNNIGIKPMVSNYETSQFTKTQAVNYPIQQKQTPAETPQPEKSSKRVLAPSAKVKERVNAKRRSYATARYTRVADNFLEADLIGSFDTNISTGGGEVSGVYSLKNDSTKVIRVKPYAMAVHSSEKYAEEFLKDASAFHLFPKNVMKSYGASHFADGNDAKTYRVMERAHGTSDFTKATKQHLSQLVKDIAILIELGLQVDAKPRNMLYNETEGFKIFDIGLSTFHTDSKGQPLSFNDFLKQQDKNVNKHLNNAVNTASKYLGGVFSPQELVDSLLKNEASITSNLSQKRIPALNIEDPKSIKLGSDILKEQLAKEKATPVDKTNTKPTAPNYETSKFTKTQAVNYPVQQKQTPAEPLTPSRLADRNAVKIKQHSTYTYNTKPVEVLLGRFDQAGAAVRVKQHSIYTHRVNSTNPRLGRFDQAGAGLRVKQHSTYTYSSKATNPRLGRVGQAGAAVKIKQHSTYTHAPNATNPRLGRVGQAGAGLNTNYRPPVPTPPVITPPVAPPPAPPKPAPKKTSGFSNIGNSARLFSFDTETTGVNPAHSRIWQMGYATTDQKGSFSLLDAHLNPHPDFDNLPKEELEEYLRKVNGEFSEKAFKEGNFNSLIDAYLNKDLQHIGDAFENTLQKLQLGDILIMQNMNFENNMLAANIGIDKIPQPFYDELQAKLATTSADKKFDRAGKELFQRAFKVQKYMREADYEFNTKFLPNRTENNFAKYVTQLNNAYDAYDDIIKAVHPNSKVPIIELMDISKIFYGNLAATGLIEKETAGLGLNVDFLTRALFGRKEVHTAASDAKDTIEIFQSLWKHIGDMRNGVVTDELRALAKKVNEQQPEEINRRFISSLKSTLDDFVNKGFTKTRSGANRYYGGEISVFNNETGIAERSAPISVGVKKDFTSDLETALKDQVAKYAELYKDDIMGFNREKFVDDILANAEDLNGNHSIKQLLDSVGKVELPSDRSLLPKAVGDIINKAGLPTDALVENRGFAGGGKVALGLAGVVGLAAMMLTPAPKQKEENNDPVFYNFYDEQYLGTGFVEFKERNKRYVY